MAIIELRLNPLHPSLVVVDVSCVIIGESCLTISVIVVSDLSEKFWWALLLPLTAPPLLARVLGLLLMLASDSLLIVIAT